MLQAEFETEVVMRIQIIGLGTVGLAQAYFLSKWGHEVLAYDIIRKSPPSYVKLVESLESDVDVTFICTPESTVENVVLSLKKCCIEGFLVIKSTTPPGTTRKLMEKYKLHICHNPEFLREKYLFKDVMKPSRVIIGQCCVEHGNFLRILYAPLDSPIYITDPTTSELVKLTTNALRATAITFWNEVHELSKRLGISTEEVAEMVDQAKTLGEWEGGRWGVKFFGRPYGGKCLPKDVKQMIEAFRNRNLNPLLFEAIEKVNERIGNNRDDAGASRRSL